MLNPEIIETINKTVTQITDVQKILLFGSYARGEETTDSDIDICVITEDPRRKLELMKDMRYSIFTKIKAPLDILVYKPEEFNIRSHMKYTLEEEIAKEGVLLYE